MRYINFYMVASWIFVLHISGCSEPKTNLDRQSEETMKTDSIPKIDDWEACSLEKLNQYIKTEKRPVLVLALSLAHPDTPVLLRTFDYSYVEELHRNHSNLVVLRLDYYWGDPAKADLISKVVENFEYTKGPTAWLYSNGNKVSIQLHELMDKNKIPNKTKIPGSKSGYERLPSTNARTDAVITEAKTP